MVTYEKVMATIGLAEKKPRVVMKNIYALLHRAFIDNLNLCYANTSKAT